MLTFFSHELDNPEQMNSKTIIYAGLVAVGVISGTCRGADVAENWAKHCASCHGKDGKGQTKAGRMAGVKDQTDAQYQSTLTDEKMFKSIKEGLKDGAKEKMKPFSEKLSDAEIKELVAQVRSLKK